MNAVAAHVLDDAPPPADLVTALNCRHWHTDIMSLPAGWLRRMNTALNVYDALTSWQAASGHTAEWTRRNPQAWELVSAILRERIGKNGT